MHFYMIISLLFGAVYSLQPLDVEGPASKMTALNIKRQPVGSQAYGSPFSKRATPAPATLYSRDGGIMYIIEASVGTPPQPISLHFDTGSSDLWLPWVNSSLCVSNAEMCEDGSFDHTASSTFTEADLPMPFEISYLDGTEVTGSYMTDTLTVGDLKIDELIMALGENQQGAPAGLNESFRGIMGVGFDTHESGYREGDESTLYPNLISRLAMQGSISTRAYSVWLNPDANQDGEVLFGGVDPAKYTNELVVLPLQPSPETETIDRFLVTLSSLSIGTDEEETDQYTTDMNTLALLDTGTAVTWLPPRIVDEIMASFDVFIDTEYGPVIPCELAAQNLSLDFGFGGPEGPHISVPLDAMIFEKPEVTLEDGSSVCVFLGIQSSQADFAILGDTFLHSAYVVYNIEGSTVAIAQANPEPAESAPQEITEADVIPGATSTAEGVPLGTPAMDYEPETLPLGSGDTDVAYPTAPPDTVEDEEEAISSDIVASQTGEVSMPSSSSEGASLVTSFTSRSSAAGNATARSTSTSRASSSNGHAPVRPSTPLVALVAVGTIAMVVAVSSSLLMFR